MLYELGSFLSNNEIMMVIMMKQHLLAVYFELFHFQDFALNISFNP